MNIEKYKVLLDDKRARIAEVLSLNVEPFDLKKYLKKNRLEAERHAKSLMPEHVVVMEMAVKSMLLLTQYLYDGPGRVQRNAFLAQIHRALNLLIASSELILSGLEETARVTSRSYIEALDISLAILSDASFAERFFGDDANYSSLWEEEIGYGRIYSYVRKALGLAELGDEADEVIDRRRKLKNLLSDTVHCDDSGALRSWAISPLGWPDMISTEPHGVISFHAANHVAALSSETYRFLSIFIKCLMLEKLDDMHKFSRDTDESNVFFAHFMAFQEIIHEYELPDGSDILAEGHVPEKGWDS